MMGNRRRKSYIFCCTLCSSPYAAFTLSRLAVLSFNTDMKHEKGFIINIGFIIQLKFYFVSFLFLCCISTS